MILVGEEISGLNLRELARVRSIHFHAKLAVMVLVTAASVTASLMLPGLWWIFPTFILGLAYAHGVELQHQCLHNTAYRSKAWNRLVGVTVGLPSLVSFSDYQNSHLKHHRLLGTPEDKEFFNYSYQKLTSVLSLIPHLWMVRHYRDVAGFIVKSMAGKLIREKDALPKVAKKIRSEYILMGIFLITMAAITVYFQTDIFLKLWVIPFLIAVPTHALIELPEHIGCNTKVPDVLQNTRSIKTNKFVVWFVDGNNYHVEHHWLPGVPNDQFVELHKSVNSRIVYLESSYWSFYKQFFHNLRKRNLHRSWEPMNKQLIDQKKSAAHSS